MACKNGVCGVKKPNKYQVKANKKVQKINAKAAANQAKQQARAQAAQPTVTGGPPAITPEMVANQSLPGMQNTQGNGLQALGGGLPPLAGGQKDYSRNPITYTHKGPGFFSSVDPTTQYYPIYDPEQQYSLDQLLRSGFGGVSNLDPLNFEPLAQQAQREFSTQTVPSLAERFTALGGGQRSSAFQGALGQSASDLQSQLAALRSKYGLAANEQLHNQGLQRLQLGLQPRYESVFNQRQPSGVSSLFGGLSQGIGQSLGSLAKIGLGI